jgi:hypothetical protein
MDDDPVFSLPHPAKLQLGGDLDPIGLAVHSLALPLS